MNSYPWKMNNLATQNSGLSEKNANVNHLIFESSSSDETEIQSESESINLLQSEVERKNTIIHDFGTDSLE